MVVMAFVVSFSKVTTDCRVGKDSHDDRQEGGSCRRYDRSPLGGRLVARESVSHGFPREKIKKCRMSDRRLREVPFS